MNFINREFNILANFLVINGSKCGKVIPYLEHCDDVLQKHLGIDCTLNYDKDHGSIFITSDDLKVNGIKKVKALLRDGDIIQINDIKLRFYIEDFNSVFRISEIYSDVFYNEPPFFRRELMYILMRYEYLKVKRYGINFSLIFVKFVDSYLYQIKDILTNILKENLRDTDFISDISENDIIIFLPFLKKEDCENVMNRISSEISRLLPEINFIKNYLSLDKSNIDDFDNFIKVLCHIFNI
ncbi:MAG: hypothetical protein N3A58_07610 [Spirochaetes bacterium]|nr:hypothetical protein [Spirochaetota bacterium]